MQLCMQIAKGEPFWDLRTKRSEVLYLALEDSEQRMQRRLLTITDSPSANFCIALECSPLGDELARELGSYARSHPELRLIVIDTFQMIRPAVSQMSYANDYKDVSRLKSMADALGICILLVHHTRKLGDSDSFNEISGTNGIAGCADTLMVLKKEKRTSRKATLTCTGRDIEDIELELVMSPEDCVWLCEQGCESMCEQPMPEELRELAAFIKSKGMFTGLNSDLKEELEKFTGHQVNIMKLKRVMGIFRYELEDMGVYFDNVKKNGARGIEMVYRDLSKVRDS